jgi:hypothetical protein
VIVNNVRKAYQTVFNFRNNHMPIIAKPQREPVPAYDFSVEVNDPNALDELVMDPDEMRMQALLIRERILGPVHPDTSYYIRFRGAVYADSGRFDRESSSHSIQ